MEEVGKVTYRIVGDNSPFKQDTEESKRIAEGAATQIGQAFDNAMSRAAGFVKQAFESVLRTGIEYNARMQSYTTALTTALGDEGKALETISKIQQDAAKTPFDMAGLTQANLLLIAAGESAEGARDTILALGDAVSATGGGNDQLQRMALNLQQVRNLGKATQIDIRQFQLAGIDLYGILADYTGKTAEEVRGLDVTYELLTESLKAAASEGGRYFAAMEAQSRTFNGQLSTLKDNAAATAGAITEGLFQRLAEDVLPKINEVIQSIDTEGISNALAGIADALVSVLSVAVELAPVILAVAAAIAAAQIAKKIITGVQTVIHALQEAAAAGLTLTSKIQLISAAVTAMIVLGKAYADELNRIRNRYKELTDAVNTNAKALEENQQKIKLNKDASLTLAAQITALAQNEHKTVEQKRDLIALIDQLNANMPELNLLYDEQTGALNMSTAAVIAYIEEQSKMDEATERVRAFNEAQMQRAELEQQLAEAEVENSALIENYTGGFVGFMMQFTAGAPIIQGALKANQEAVDDLSDAVNKNQEIIENYGSGTASAVQNGAQVTSEACEQMKASIKSYGERWNETHKSVAQAVNSEIGLFEDMSLKSTQSIDKLIGALKSQTSYMDDYQKNINKAMELGVDQGLVKKLSDGSKESAEILAAIVKDGGKNIDELNEEFRRSEEGKEAFIDTLTTLQTTTEQDMQNMVGIIGRAVDDMNMFGAAEMSAMQTMQGYLQGIQRYEKEINDAYARIAQNGQKTLAMVNDAHSPSRKFAKQGEYVGEGYAKGILKLVPVVEQAAIELGEASLPDMKRIQADFSASLPSMETLNQFIQPAAQFMGNIDVPKMAAPVVLELDGREIARATAWWTSEQMAWEEM